MPDLVISNTSPLFYLHRLRRLDLLQKLYQQVIVPVDFRLSDAVKARILKLAQE